MTSTEGRESSVLALVSLSRLLGDVFRSADEFYLRVKTLRFGYCF